MTAAPQQNDVIEFLMRPETFGVPAVERVDTHASIVFLAGSHAYKLKRAVRYDYLDFSTLERRREMCAAELRLNVRAAPSLYSRVLPVTCPPDGRLALGGEGPAVEWLLEMNRFDQELLLDRLATSGRLGVDAMPALAEAVARFHAGARRRLDHGGFGGIAWVIDGNEHGFAAEAAGVLDPAMAADVTGLARAAADRHRAHLEARRIRGLVRECHGDLHLRNIVLLDGRPTLFDAVEFNDDISCVDILYDTAFLLMDLWQRELLAHAARLFNRLLALDEDFDGLALLPLFLSTRAAVRAKTSATAARLEPDGARRAALEATARRYLSLAARLLQPPPARLVAIGGLSGTGKSTTALALAPQIGGAPGAVVLRSDEVRKRLLGVDRLAPLGPDGYTPELSARVYEELRQRAQRIVAAGHTAIVDAVFAGPDERERIERVAVEAGVPFAGLWLEAPLSVLEARVTARTADPSDADAGVVRAQAARGAGPVGWRRLDASPPPEAVVAAARAAAGVED